jgi:hypothetical protein
MASKFVFLLTLASGAHFLTAADSAQRWAVVAAHASTTANAKVEDRLTDELTAQLTGQPGVLLIDRASIDKVLKEQNFQQSDRSSADTAARIGKLLGVDHMVIVQVYDFTYSANTEQSSGATRTTGTIVLRANAKMVETETAVIRTQPSSSFQESVPISESKQGGQPIRLGGFTIPGGGATKKGGDPKVIEDNERVKATTAVAKDLAGKLSYVNAAAPSAPVAPRSVNAVVAGIANGAVYINQGSATGVKAGDRFQIVREVPLGFDNPTTKKPMTEKKVVCILTIAAASEDSASGGCDGGIPQREDIAASIR